MKSNYEKKEFAKRFLLITGIYLLIILLFIVLIWDMTGDIVHYLLIAFYVISYGLTAYVYYFSKKTVDKAYSSVERASDMMQALIKDSESDILSSSDTNLEEGTVGILYDNFSKVVNIFREGKRKEMEEKEYLMKVMSDISHQLKTPLASMTLFLDLLLSDKIKDEDEKTKILKESLNQVSRMEWMVLAMLKLARIEAGAVAFDIKKVNLNSVLAEVVGSLSYLTKTRGQMIKISCPENIKVKADGQWLVEALINIVKNASDYSYEKSDLIEINVEQNNVFTRIYIVDHGIGMTEEEMIHVFERFYRVDKTVNPNSVGIGLSLSKSIIEKMDGKLSVDSCPDKGTKFTIQLI